MTVEQAIEALEENDKLKNDIKHMTEYIDEASARHTEMQDNIAKLLEENEKLKGEKEELEADLHNLEMAKVSQMSSVEVLDFFANTYQNPKLMYDIFGKQSVVSILRKINAKKVTSKEIVEKITEYEKSKENNSEDFLHTNLDEYFNEDVSNSKESFKVGDYVKVVMGVNKGIQGTIKEFNFFNNKVLLDNHYHVLLKEIEHAEPPKEEPQVEWVCECYCDVNIFYCRDEEFAIRWCERKSKEIGTESYYRKVCRKK